MLNNISPALHTRHEVVGVLALADHHLVEDGFYMLVAQTSVDLFLQELAYALNDRKITVIINS